jgi:adenylosuccinate synthase
MKKTKVWLVAGLGYGDEGKGSFIDYLVRREGACAVVRYNGGAQAGHRVELENGQSHIFSQFGSGTLVPGVLTYLSRFMLGEPIGMMKEYEHLRELGCDDAFLRTVIDEKAPIITPFHIAANRLLELSRGASRHGSCGLGIGETIEDAHELGENMLCASDLKDISVLRKKLLMIRQRKLSKLHTIVSGVFHDEEFGIQKEILQDPQTVDWCMARYAEFAGHANVGGGPYLAKLLSHGPVIFEGAQGMLLDVNHGFYPHVTKTDITYHNAMILLYEAGYAGPQTKIGVVRGYLTRHGAGPFVTEDETLSRTLQDEGNEQGKWQGKFRVGYFDLVAVRYALEAIGGIDELAITNLDRLIGLSDVKICKGYKVSGREQRFIDRIEAYPPVNQTRQCALTAWLRQVRPVYEHQEPIKDEHQARIYGQNLADNLGYPLSIVSFGPTAKDKTIFSKPR